MNSITGISSITGLASVSFAVTTSFDSDSEAFFTATGITDATTKNAIDALVVAAKSNGWWTLCNAIYPMVGGTSSTNKYNLKNPLDTDGAFRLSYSGSQTFASTGITWSGTGYADTHLVPNSILSLNALHFSIYARTAGSTPGASGIGDNPMIVISKRESDGNCFYAVNEGSGAVVANGTATGFYLLSRDGATDVKIYRNSSLLGSSSNATSGSMSLVSMYLGDCHVASQPFFPETDCEYSFATIGASVNGTIAALMYSDIQTFQTALSRQI